MTKVASLFRSEWGSWLSKSKSPAMASNLIVEFFVLSQRDLLTLFLDYGWRDAAGHGPLYEDFSYPSPISISIWNCCPSIEREIKLCYVVYRRS